MAKTGSSCSPGRIPSRTGGSGMRSGRRPLASIVERTGAIGFAELPTSFKLVGSSAKPIAPVRSTMDAKGRRPDRIPEPPVLDGILPGEQLDPVFAISRPLHAYRQLLRQMSDVDASVLRPYGRFEEHPQVPAPAALLQCRPNSV